MLIDDIVDMAEVMRQVESGMVKMQERAGLVILNYTQMAQFTPALWNATTDQCRGLIFDEGTHEVYARPFPKFWNINDARHPETLMENLPASVPSITRKHDGSLGIGYKIGPRVHVATRGSFNSDQARWATRWIQANTPEMWPVGWTPLFEVVYAENQIVVNYDGWEGLILLAMVNIETGEEATRAELERWAEMNRVRLVEDYDKALGACLIEDVQNEEGYVLSWNLGSRPPLKVKVKFETYCRLHKLLTQTSAIGVWEMLRDGQDVEALTVDVPADFSAWIRGIEAKLRAEFKVIEDAALVAMLEYQGEKTITNAEEKKSFALYALTKGPLTPILFAMVSGKQYAGIIWKSLRPDGRECRVFKADEE